MALHNFVPGESASVAENLDANFSFLLNLIQANSGSIGTATGSSTALAKAVFASSGRAAATGTSTATATSGSASQKSAVATATGSAAVAAFTTGSTEGVATATGTSTAAGFDSTSRSSVGTATGVADGTVVGAANSNSRGAATGTSTATATSARQLSTVGTATGSSTALGTGSGSAIESLDGTTNTGPTTTTIFASNTPGTASGTLNSFSLTASPGIIVFNGSNDTSVANPVELYYLAHVIYVENVAGNWFRWASANTWTSTASPVPVVITESVEGKILTLASDTIYASANFGQAAPTGATVTNGQLETWTINGNPGQVVRNGVVQDGTSGSSFTSNVIELYYRQHRVWQENSTGAWWQWQDNTNFWGTQQATGPVPTTPTINVAIIQAQTTNQTFTVSGTYQDFTGTGNPTLQYTDNLTTATGSTTWNTTDKTAGITLSNTSLTASSTVSGSSTSVRSTTSFSTGKKIFEITGSTLTGNWTAGIADAAFSLTTGLGDTADSFAFQPNLASPGGQALIYNGAVISSESGVSSANGDKFTFCVDFGAKKIWVTSTAMRNAGFPWNNGLIGAQNPANGTGGVSYTFTTAGLICFNEFDTGGVAVMNTAGPFAVSIPSGFSAWDTTTTTTWNAFPSTVSVTPTSWSFVHPPVTTQQASANVAVRDANNTGTIGTSNNFQIQAPAVTTLSPMTLDKATVTAGQPAGALVGNVTIPTSGGSFIGTVTTNNSNFQVTGTGSPRQLVTTAVLGANPGIAITLTANQTGAVNTGETLNVTIVVTAESPTATAVTTVGPTIVGSNTPGTAGGQLTWALATAGTGKTNFQIKLNGVTQTFSNAVTELYYINHTLYYSTNPTTWFAYNGTAPVSGQLAQANFPSSSSPIPVITPSGTTFQPNTNGPTGITFALNSAGTAMSNVTWSEDSNSFMFVGNALSTSGSLPAGTYTLNVTATVA